MVKVVVKCVCFLSFPDKMNNLTESPTIFQEDASVQERKPRMISFYLALLISPSGLIANIVAVTLFIRHKIKLEAHKVFILSLCIHDAVFCGLVLPVLAYVFYNPTKVLSDNACQLLGMMLLFLQACLSNLVILISINRFVKVVFSSKYQKIYSVSKSIGYVIGSAAGIFILIIPAITGSWGKFGWDQQSRLCSLVADEFVIYRRTLLFIVAGLPILVVFFVYGSILFYVKRQINKVNSVHITTVQNINSGIKANSSTAPSQNGILFRTSSLLKRKDFYLLVMAFAIVTFYITTKIPLYLMSVFDPNWRYMKVTQSLMGLYWMQSIINPVIYVVANKKLRGEFKLPISLSVQPRP